MARPILDAGIDELLLEGGDEMKPARRIERGDGAAQELARAALPRAAVGVADIAEDEMLRRGAVGEIDTRLGAHVWHHHEVAAGAERRIEDRPEGRLHQIGVGPADALLLAGPKLARRKSLAAHMAGDVAVPYKDQFLTQHCVIPSLARHGHLLETPHHCHGRAYPGHPRLVLE